jgi:hypothetical protein
MAKVKMKQVQIHESWPDGRNTVYPSTVAVKWADFSKAGIRRRIDWATGKPFLLLLIKHQDVDPDQTYYYA